MMEPELPDGVNVNLDLSKKIRQEQSEIVRNSQPYDCWGKKSCQFYNDLFDLIWSNAGTGAA